MSFFNNSSKEKDKLIEQLKSENKELRGRITTLGPEDTNEMKKLFESLNLFSLQVLGMKELIKGGQVMNKGKEEKEEKTPVQNWGYKGDVNKINDKYRTHTKVFFIGPYKSGKTTLLGNVMGGLTNVGDAVKNTCGIDIFEYETGFRNKILFHDTEGFFQPISNDDPIFRGRYIKEFVKSAADLLIVVYDRLTTNDLSPLHDIIEFFQNSNNMDLIIVHNLKDANDNQAIEYAQKLSEVFGGEIDKQQPFTVEVTTAFKSIVGRKKMYRHFVAGNYSQQVYKKVYTVIADVVNNKSSSVANFKDCFIDAAIQTLSNFCAVPMNEQINSKEGKSNSFILEKEKVQINKEFHDGLDGYDYFLQSKPLDQFRLQSNDFSTRFVISKEGAKRQFITLIIENSGIDIDSLKIVIPSEQRISIECSRIQVLSEGVKSKKFNMNLYPPIPILKSIEALVYSTNNRFIDQNGFTIIKFKTQAITTLFSTELLESDLVPDKKPIRNKLNEDGEFINSENNPPIHASVDGAKPNEMDADAEGYKRKD